MEGRLPLVIAVLTGSAAIAIVAIDLQFSIDAQLQEREGDGWVTVGTADETRPYFGCAGNELRLQVENGRLLAADIPVSIGYWSPSGGHTTVLSETWHMARGEVRHHAFTIPVEAFQSEQGKANVSVDVQVAGEYLGTCVEAP